MITSFEETLSNYPYLLQLGGWFGAIATFMAVCWSINLSKRKSKIDAHLKIGYISEGLIYTDEVFDDPSKTNPALWLSVLNHGPNSLYLNSLTSFALQIPLIKESLNCVRPSIPKENIITIHPGLDKSIVFEGIASDIFKKYFLHIMNQKKRKLIKVFSPSYSLKRVKIFLVTSTGRFVKVKASKEVIKHIKIAASEALEKKP